MFKKIVVCKYGKGDCGQMMLKMTMTTRKPVEASSYQEAKEKVQQLILRDVISEKRFTVEWQRDGFSEGYMVSL